MAGSRRGNLYAALAMPAVLLVVVLMLPGPIALAGSSILEVEPSLSADSRHSPASLNEKPPNSETSELQDSSDSSAGVPEADGGSDDNGGCAAPEAGDGSDGIKANQDDHDQEVKSDDCDHDDEAADPAAKADEDEFAADEDNPTHPGVQLSLFRF
jgi:hypothetical protein